MCHVGILADDLTGALDAAAPFASPAAPVAVVWGEAGLDPKADFAIDSETRGVASERAAARVTASLARLGGCDIAFKKIDSLMRGNTVAELVACCTAKGFASVVIAPAFPEQHRITRGGRQFVGDDSGEWRAIEVNLGESLLREAVAAKLIGRGARFHGQGIFLCDAETDGDLDWVASSAVRLPEPILWCGSAGLARALRASPIDGYRPVGRRTLVVIGSRHPVSARQRQRLEYIAPESVTAIDLATPLAASIAAVERRLDGEGSAALSFALPALDAEAAEEIHRDAFASLAEVEAPETLVVVGGDTLFRLCGALGASRLDAIGEWAPGIAVSRFADGAWRGADVISKSGAFGDDDLLTRLMGTRKEMH